MEQGWEGGNKGRAGGRYMYKTAKTGKKVDQRKKKNKKKWLGGREILNFRVFRFFFGLYILILTHFVPLQKMKKNALGP